jgi:hypothetical protein
MDPNINETLEKLKESFCVESEDDVLRLLIIHYFLTREFEMPELFQNLLIQLSKELNIFPNLINYKERGRKYGNQTDSKQI